MKKPTRLPLLPGVLFFFLIFTAPPLFAQVIYVGENEGTTSDMDPYPNPYGEEFKIMRAQYLYRASELAAVTEAGLINAVGFTVTGLNGVDVIENFRISMALMADSSLGDWVNTTQVFSADYQPVVGDNIHYLDQPFFWDGVSSLVVEICFTQPNDESSNPFVVLTTDLPFVASRTVRSNSAIQGGCNYTGSTSPNTHPEDRPRLALIMCRQPSNLTVTGISSTGAQISWSPAGGVPGLVYELAYGTQGFNPNQPDITPINDTTVVLSGLSGGNTYDVYVRTQCDGQNNSAWFGPVTFTTPASCNDAFVYYLDPFNPIPPLVNYPANVDTSWIFCPDLNNQAISLEFAYLSIGPGDSLILYNGPGTDYPVLHVFTDTVIVPQPDLFNYTATVAPGCITVVFHSDATVDMVYDFGWVGEIDCAQLANNECYEVLRLQADSVFSTTAYLSWLPMFGASGYIYSWQEVNGGTIQSDTTTGSSAVLTGLEGGTVYNFTVQTLCGNNQSSGLVTIQFTTPIVCPGALIGACGDDVQFTASGQGLWNIDECATTTPGKERLFRFIAPNTRVYTLRVINAVGGSVSYFYKPASEGCNASNWKCAGDFNVPGSGPLGFDTLTAGVEYYILADPETTGTVFQRFEILHCGPLNDSAFHAIPLIVDDPCLNNIYSNLASGIEPGEPSPDTVGASNPFQRWLTPADHTVWFSFEAPASETVTIITDSSGINGLGDTQIALYEVGDPGDFSTFDLIISDEDNGASSLGFNSVVSYTGLEPGKTYYIQVDGYGSSRGAFCISVQENVEQIVNQACDDDFTVEDVSGDKWFNFFTLPDNLDLGELVLALNPQGNDLGAVTVNVQTSGAIPFSNNAIPYLPAYFFLTSENDPADEVAVRVFFTLDQFNALKAAANLPNATIEELIVSHYNRQNTDCLQSNNIGSSTIIDDVTILLLGTSGKFYVEFETDSLGEFAIHLGNIALPLELKSFTGRVEGPVNRLEWVTLTEQDVQWHIVERSADGLQWSETGRRAGKASSQQELRYQLDDTHPPGQAYYRLRSVDFDGATALSNLVQLTRPGDRFGIAGVFPSPTAGALTVQVNVLAEETVYCRLTDLTGRPVFEQAFPVGDGINSLKLSLDPLAAGMYFLTVANDREVSGGVRIIKQ